MTLRGIELTDADIMAIRAATSEALASLRNYNEFPDEAKAEAKAIALTIRTFRERFKNALISTGWREGE